MKVGRKGKAAAMVVLGAGPVVYLVSGVNAVLYTRAEGNMLEKSLQETKTQVREMDSKYDGKIDRLYSKIDQLHKDVIYLIQISKSRR
jgi:Na+/phosphate symporter